MVKRLPSGIVKLENGRYRALVSAGSGAKRRRKSQTFDVLKHAIEWRMYQKLDLDSDSTYFSDDVLVTVVFNAWIKKFIEGKVTAATLKSYQDTLVMLKKRWTNTLLKMVTRTKIQLLFDTLVDAGFKKTTIKKYRVHLQRFFTDLTYEGFFKINPFYAINFGDAAKGKSSKEKVMNVNDYKALIKHLSDKDINEETVYDLAVQILLLTGLRVSEMIDLKVDDFNLEDSTIRVDTSYSRLIQKSKAPKTQNSYRTIKVPTMLSKRIEKWLELRKRNNPNDRIFLLESGSILNLNSVNYYFHKLQSNELHISKENQTSTHSIRHTFASYLLSPDGGGHSVQFIADILGDTQSTVQDVYLHLLEDERVISSEKLVEKFDGLFC